MSSFACLHGKEHGSVLPGTSAMTSAARLVGRRPGDSGLVLLHRERIAPYHGAVAGLGGVHVEYRTGQVG